MVYTLLDNEKRAGLCELLNRTEMLLNNSVPNICCITTNMECTIIQLIHLLIYPYVNIYTAQTNTFSQVKYYHFSHKFKSYSLIRLK